MSFTMLPAPFRQIQSSPLAMRSQRAVYQEIRSTPYNHPPNVYLPTVPPQLLLPSSSSHNFSTNYNPDQSFIMHSTAPPVARGLIAVEEKRTSPTFDSSPIAKSNKSIGQGSKIKVQTYKAEIYLISLVKNKIWLTYMVFNKKNSN